MEKETAAAILTNAKATSAHIDELHRAINAEIDDIMLLAAQENRALSDDDIERRDKLRADQKKLRKAFIELGFVTLERLNKSADVEKLKGSLEAINTDLTADLNRMKAIARFADTAAKVTDGLAKLVKKVAGVLV